EFDDPQVPDPETISSPTRMSRPPPRRIMSRWWLRKKDIAPIKLVKPRAMKIKGRPRPRQYTNAKTTPRTGLGEAAEDNSKTAESVGPIHGAQPRPKITPSMGAPTRPALGR